eukprot:m.382635 g.382635  ORF g.382635 m.382635 type:complete len:74 (+) comp28257_c0_seq43:3509-3730(+)
MNTPKVDMMPGGGAEKGTPVGLHLAVPLAPLGVVLKTESVLVLTLTGGDAEEGAPVGLDLVVPLAPLEEGPQK